ncbi:hypothetical protein ACP70R_008582 [Stipagrostis hirtigluma subsp. patula]
MAAEFDDRDVDGGEGPEVRMVEIPRSYLVWILSQKRRAAAPAPTSPRTRRLGAHAHVAGADRAGVGEGADARDTEDEFFRFQAFVRDVFTKHGYVMMPEDRIPDGFKE